MNVNYNCNTIKCLILFDDVLILSLYSIVGVEVLGQLPWNDKLKLASQKVYIDFGEYGDYSYKYYFQPDVFYFDRDLDVALLQLNTADRVIFPPALKSFQPFGDIHKITILGHGTPDPYNPKTADILCDVITNTSHQMSAAEGWFNTTGKILLYNTLKQLGHTVSIDQLQSPYQLDESKHSLYDCFVTHGGSGSPILNRANAVVGLYTNGIPDFYWTHMSHQDRSNYQKYAFGRGVNFTAILNSMNQFAAQTTLPVQLTDIIIKDIFG